MKAWSQALFCNLDTLAFCFLSRLPRILSFFLISFPPSLLLSSERVNMGQLFKTGLQLVAGNTTDPFQARVFVPDPSSKYRFPPFCWRGKTQGGNFSVEFQECIRNIQEKKRRFLYYGI